MATRSLTEVFILMRNNALQSRNIFSDQLADDRMALVSGVNIDLESGSVNTRSSRLPPEWVDGVEEVQYELTRIKQKMKELSLLHDKHLTRPAFDESVDEEHAIEIQTQEITQMFSHCQRLIQQIQGKSRKGTDMELQLSRNIVMSLVRSVQELSNSFRKTQSNYLRKMRSREERSQFFDANVGPDTGLLADDPYADTGMYDRGFSTAQLQLVDDNSQEVQHRAKEIAHIGFTTAQLQLVDDNSQEVQHRAKEIAHIGFSTAQLQLVDDNSQEVQHRAKEIAHIVRSITDLNDIFKDMSNMIVDQGTILDRIDYNIEHASVQVEKGLQQLSKAEKDQKKNRKMYIIVILALIIIIMIIILVATKS